MLKRILVGLLCLWMIVATLPIDLQAQSTTFPTPAQYTTPALITTTTVTGTSFSVSGFPIGAPTDLHYWTMSWWAVGTVSTCQVKLEKSTDNSTFSDLIANQTCTSTGTTASATAGETNYIRLNVGTKSGTGTVIVIARGWTQNPSGTVTVSATLSPSANQVVSTSLGSGGGALAVAGTASDGTTATNSPVQVGGVDGSGLVQALRTSASGAVVIDATGTAIPVSFSAASSQVVNTALNASSGTVAVTGSASDGSAATFSPVQTAGVDGAGNIQAFRTSTSGAIVIDATGTAIPVSFTAASSQVVNTALNASSGTVAVTGSASSGTAATFSPVGVGGKDTNGFRRDILTSPIGAVIVDFSSTNSVTTTPSASGTQFVTTALGAGSGTVTIVGSATDNTTATFSPVQVGGVDSNGKIQALQVEALTGAAVVTTSASSQTILQTQTDTIMVGGVNIKEINGVAPLMNNGAVGVGALRVTVASDSTGTTVVTQSTTGNLHAMTDLEQVKGSTVAVAAGTPGVQVVAIVDSNGAPILRTDVVNVSTALGAGSGTLAIAGTASDGTTATFSPVQVAGVDGGGLVQALRTSVSGAVVIDSTGTAIPVSFSAASSQVVNTSLNASSGTVAVTGSASDGTAATFSPIQIAGVDGGGLIQALRTSSSGAIVIDATGTAIPVSFTPASTQTVTTALNFGLGTVAVTGAASSGTTSVGSPVMVAAATGGTTYTIASDVSGRLILTGQAPNSTPTTGNPVVIGVTTAGSSYQVAGDTTGRQIIVGAAPNLTATVGAPVLIGGSTGSITYQLATDTSGRAIMTGPAPTSTPTTGNPIVIGITTAGSTYQVAGDTTGRQMIVGAAPTSTATVGAPVLIGGSTGSVTYQISTDTAGRQIITGAGTGAIGVQIIQCDDKQDMVIGSVTVTSATTANVAWYRNNGSTTTATAFTGAKFYIHSMQIVNSGATNVTVAIQQDGAAGVAPITLTTQVAPTNTTPFGGSNVTFPSPLFNPTVGRAISPLLSGSSSSVFVSMQGCIAP